MPALFAIYSYAISASVFPSRGFVGVNADDILTVCRTSRNTPDAGI